MDPLGLGADTYCTQVVDLSIPESQCELVTVRADLQLESTMSCHAIKLGNLPNLSEGPKDPQLQKGNDNDII